MTQPLISVLVPVYGVEAVLRRCVDSILQQTYQNLQIVLVDDCSPDGCPQICDEYAAVDPRIEVIHHAKNGGISAARNTGLAAAKGEFVAFVDSDDYVEPDFIAFLYSLIEKYDAQISACGAKIVRVNGQVDESETFDDTLILTPKQAIERMCYNDRFYITIWDKLYRKDLFQGILFPEGKLFEDTAITAKIAARAQKIVTCGVGKYFYVYYESSITNSRFTRSKLDYLDAADGMAEFIVGRWQDLKPAAERKQLHAAFSTLCQLASSGTRDREIEAMLMSRIRSLRRSVLFNPKAPKRDKIAILSLLFGYPVFRFSLRCYRKVKKGL